MRWLVALIALTIACSSGPAVVYDLVITDLTLIDGTGGPPRVGVDVFVEEDRIAVIAENAPHAAEQRVDGTGKYLIPGLIDAHVHPGKIEETFPQFIYFGVTSIFVTGCSTCTDAHYARMRSAADDAAYPAPRVFHTSQHFTMEGRHPVKTYPSANWVDGKTVHYVRDLESIAAMVARVARQPIQGIKVTIEEGPEPPFVERMPQEYVAEIVRQAHAHDLEVFAHVSDNAELRIAEAAGADHLLHFVGVILDWARDEDLINRLRDRDVSWVTTLMLDRSFFYPNHPEWLEEIDSHGVYDPTLIDRWRGRMSPEDADALQRLLYAEAFQMTDPTIEKVIAAQAGDLQKIHEKGIDLVIGTDVGSPFIFPGHSIHEEMALMAMAGFDPLEIIEMATRKGAKMLGVLDQIGTLEVGKQADMVLLDQNPLEDIRNTRSIAAVYQKGIAQSRSK